MNYETVLRITSYLDLSSYSFLPSLGGKQGRHLIGWLRKNHSQSRSSLEVRIMSVLAYVKSTHFYNIKICGEGVTFHNEVELGFLFSSPSQYGQVTFATTLAPFILHIRQYSV
jgi:hypothetical protein